MADKLAEFIDQARQKGMDHATIFLILRSSGWKEREIAEAFAARDLAMPIPQRPGVGSARDAFYHLLAFMALYIAAISLIVLLFTFIDFSLPDPATRETSWQLEYSLASVRQSLAALIVSYPLFLVVWWYLLREIRAHPDTAKTGLRRWLTSLSLFVGAVTIMTDVICVVYRLVEGDLTLRFLLKVLALLVVTGALFVYLALTLRSESRALT